MGRNSVLTRICFQNIAPAAFLFLIISSMLMGCEDISRRWSDYYYEGTNIGYQQCIERNKGMGLSEETLRYQCLSKHEQSWVLSPNARRLIEGTSGYSRTYGITKFSGTLKNLYRDRIITSISISVKRKENVDSSGAPLTERLHAENLWIEPNQTKDVEFIDLKFKPNLDNDDKHLFEWDISVVGSLKIVLR